MIRQKAAVPRLTACHINKSTRTTCMAFLALGHVAGWGPMPTCLSPKAQWADSSLTVGIPNFPSTHRHATCHAYR